MSTGMRRCFPCQSVLYLDDQLAFFTGKPGSVGDFGNFAADKQGAFFQDALVELVIFLIGGAHVDVEVVDRSAGTFVDQVGEFESLHAANYRAIVIKVSIPAANTVYDAYGFGLGHPITQDDTAIRRTGRVGQTFEFEAGEYIGQSSVTIIGHSARIEQIVSRCQDDVAHLDSEKFIFLFEIDRFGRAEFLTCLAGSPLEVDTILRHQ